MELHPFYRKLEEKFPGILSRIKDFSANPTAVSGLMVLGVARFLSGQPVKPTHLEPGEDDPEVIAMILENISRTAVLTQHEAEVLKKALNKLDKNRTFSNRGLIEKMFDFYSKGKLSHHLALRISTLSPEEQKNILSRAKKPERIPEVLLKLSRQKIKHSDEMEEEHGRVEIPGQRRELQLAVERILSSSEGRKILAEKIFEITKNNLLSDIIQNLEVKK